ncbi:unnamed protein product [[Candida] boidinii]|nr:unnamed protein product [[Candida] boidinii]
MLQTFCNEGTTIRRPTWQKARREPTWNKHERIDIDNNQDEEDEEDGEGNTKQRHLYSDPAQTKNSSKAKSKAKSKACETKHAHLLGTAIYHCDSPLNN